LKVKLAVFGIIVFVYFVNNKYINMPISNDNQDYGKTDEKNKEQGSEPTENKMTSDDLKGKKVDADLDKPTDKPTEQQK